MHRARRRARLEGRVRHARGRRAIRLRPLAILGLLDLLAMTSAIPAAGAARWADLTIVGNTGAATLQIPIEVPPGPGGLEPKLSLRYSSLGGDGPYGVGWALPLGEVRCSSRFGVPDYAFQACERFELDGQLLTRDGTTNRYHPFVETFQKIEYQSGSQSWQVTDPDGIIFRYGSESDARVRVGPDIARWLLSEIEDPFGNRIFFSYDDATDPGTRYPSLITYGPEATKSIGTRSIAFVHGETRPDPIHDHAGGIERVVSRRLTEIVVSTDGQPVRRTAFGYDLPGVDYSTGRSRLAWTQSFGSDCVGEIVECTGLPRREFEYTDSRDDGTTEAFSKFVKDENYVVPFAGNWWVGATPVRIGDVDGDGLPDLIKGGYTFGTGTDETRVEINTGSGFVEDAGWTAALRGLEVERPRADFTQIEPDDSSGSGQDVFRFESMGIFEASYSVVSRPVSDTPPAGMTRPEARYSGGAYADFSSGIPLPGWIEALGRLFVTDIDSDGLADIVVSVRLSGVDKVLAEDGTPFGPAEVEREPGRSVQRVYRNTGDPTLGWIEDPRLAAGLPPFGVVQFESGYGAESRIPFGPTTGWDILTDPSQRRIDPCSMRGLSGLWSDVGIPPEIVPDVCMNYVNLDPRFHDFNGDGYLDLMVLELDDPEALYQGFMDYARTDYDRGADAPPLPDNLARSVAWFQVPDAAAGEARWVRASTHDLPRVPFQSPEGGGHSAYAGLLPFAHSQPHLRAALSPPPNCPGPGGMPNWEFCAPLSYNTQLGVQFADLNRDGLTDVIWSRYESDGTPAWSEFPLIAQGVLLNTGRGWCSSIGGMSEHVESECAHAAIYHPPANSYPALPAEPSGFAFRDHVYTGTTTGRLADLNADGFLDYVQAHTNAAYPGNKAWLFDPGGASDSPPNVWRRDPRYDLDIDYSMIFASYADSLGFSVVDVNGDGAADIVGDSLRDQNGVEHPQAFVSRSKHADLLRLVRNGTGGIMSIDYTSAAVQRDSSPQGLEAAAAQHAAATNETLDILDASPRRDSVRWSARPVASALRFAGPNRAPDPATPTSPFGPPTTYRYAHPRHRAGSRSDLGFRTIERRLPGGEMVTQHFYQHHGRAGRTSRVRISDSGIDLHLYEEDWATRPEIPAGLPGSIDHPDIHHGRLVETRSTNLDADGASGAQSIRSFEYDDDYGHGFVSRAIHARPTGTAVVLRRPESDPTHSIFGLVAEEKTFGDPNADMADLDFLSHRRVDHLRGRPSQITEMVKARDESGGGAPERRSMLYDTYGNLTMRIVHGEDGDRITDFCHDGDHESGADADWCPDLEQSSHSVLIGRMDALGGISTFVPDSGSGSIAETHSTYADIPSTRAVLDVFGRPVAHFVSDGARWLKTVSLFYDDIATPPVIERRIHPGESPSEDEAIWSAVVTDGFGGIWKEVRETPSAFVARLTHHDPAARITRTSLPVECPDPRCTTAIGDVENPIAIWRVDGIGRVTRLETPDGFSVFSHSSIAKTNRPGENGQRFDYVLEKNGKGDLTGRATDGDRIAWVETCAGTVPPSTSGLGTVSCGGAEIPRTDYLYEATGELDAIYSPRATSPFDDPTHFLRLDRDTLGRVVRIADPALSGTGEIRRAYDAYGNLATLTNARSQVRIHSHDRLNRLTAITTPADETNYIVSYRANEMRRSGDSSEDYQRTLSHDAFGRVAQQAISIRNASGSFQRFYTDFAYDLLGRVLEIVHPARHYAPFGSEDTTVRYEYDGAYLDQVCEIGRAATCNSAATRFISDVEYDELGRLESYAMAGGVRSLRYSPGSPRLEADEFISPSYQLVRSYEDYDEVGNLVSMVGAESATPALELDASYVYDKENRLARWVKNGVGHDFLYDELQNNTQRGGDARIFDDPARPYAIQRREPDVGMPSSYTHDADGNIRTVTGETARHYTFDSANRLVCQSESSAVCDTLVAYDVNGIRIADYPSGGRAFNAYIGDDFVYSHGQIVTRASVEIMANGHRIALKRFDPELRVAGDAPPGLPPSTPLLAMGIGCGAFLFALCVSRRGRLCLVEIRPLRAATSMTLASSLLLPSVAIPAISVRSTRPQYAWDLSDPLGTGTVMLDATGTRLRHQVFTPFGRIHEEIGSKFRTRYAGHPRDDESGLFYMRARWYDPSIGRFLSVDPLLVPGVPHADNPYAYAYHNPILFSDPTGMFGEEARSIETEFTNAGEFGAGHPDGGSHPVRPIGRLASSVPGSGVAGFANFAAAPAHPSIAAGIAGGRSGVASVTARNGDPTLVFRQIGMGAAGGTGLAAGFNITIDVSDPGDPSLSALTLFAGLGVGGRGQLGGQGVIGTQFGQREPATLGFGSMLSGGAFGIGLNLDTRIGISSPSTEITPSAGFVFGGFACLCASISIGPGALSRAAGYLGRGAGAVLTNEASPFFAQAP